MPLLTIDKQYDDGVVLTEAQLDAMVDSIETFVNITKLDSDNLQNQAVIESKIASNAVTTAALAPGAVTGAKVSDGSITRAKLVPLDEETSSDFTGSLTDSMADLSGLSCTITTTGRPVLVAMVASGASHSFWSVGGTGLAVLQIIRDGATVVSKIEQAAPSSFPAYMLLFDPVVAGTYTYKIQGQKDASATSTLNNVKLVVVEM